MEWGVRVENGQESSLRYRLVELRPISNVNPLSAAANVTLTQQ